jgi:hypothetical protein
MSLFLAVCLQNELVMYASINGTHYEFKTALTFSFGVTRERVKRPVLVSGISSSNITLCRWQQVARELRVELACLNHNFHFVIVSISLII